MSMASEKSNRFHRPLCVLLFALAATGCARGITSTPGDAPNLEKWVADVQARPAPALRCRTTTDHSAGRRSPRRNRLAG
jgi:Tfp pilus assembly protein PilP